LHSIAAQRGSTGHPGRANADYTRAAQNDKNRHWVGL
jgi:hypothetical protein